MRQAISVVKKRSGRHERTIREFRLTDQGIQVGEPLEQFRGILTGVPVILALARQVAAMATLRPDGSGGCCSWRQHPKTPRFLRGSSNRRGWTRFFVAT